MQFLLRIRHLLDSPRTWVLFASIVVGLLAAWMAQNFLSEKVSEIESRAKVDMTRVVVAKKDLRPGERLNADTLAIRQVPMAWAHSNAVQPDQFSLVDQRSISVGIKAGEPLLWAMLEGQKVATFSRKVANGRRAITVPVDQINSISGLLEPGDRIDLLLTLKNQDSTRLEPLLSNVEVLAAGQRLSGDGPAGTNSRFSTVTLNVSPEEAQRVVLGREAGRLTALLRNPSDVASFRLDREALDNLFGGKGAQGSNGPVFKVPVIYGGNLESFKNLSLLPGSDALTGNRNQE